MFIQHRSVKPTNVTTTLCAFILLLTAVMTMSDARAAWYAKFDGIDGSSTQTDHEKWINVTFFSSQLTVPLSTAGGGMGGKMHLEDILIGIISDKALPKLLESAVKGNVFKKVEIHGTALYSDAGEQTYLQYELKNAQITSYSLSGMADLTGEVRITSQAGNIVHDTYNASGLFTGRDVQSFRIDPATGLADFDFMNPVIPYAGGGNIQVQGTPDYMDTDTDADGIADQLMLTNLSSSGVDGVTYALEPVAFSQGIRVPLSLIHGDGSNVSRIVGHATSTNSDVFSFGVERELKSSGANDTMFGDLGTIFTHTAEYGTAGAKGGNVEFEWKVEKGERFVEVARGLATAEDSYILTSFDSSAIPTEAVSINYNEVKWTYTGVGNATLPGLGNLTLDPAQTTTLTLRALVGNDAALRDFSLGFGNFSRVTLGRVAGVPEPATIGLLLISLSCLTTTRRSNH